MQNTNGTSSCIPQEFIFKGSLESKIANPKVQKTFSSLNENIRSFTLQNSSKNLHTHDYLQIYQSLLFQKSSGFGYKEIISPVQMIKKHSQDSSSFSENSDSMMKQFTLESNNNSLVPKQSFKKVKKQTHKIEILQHNLDIKIDEKINCSRPQSMKDQDKQSPDLQINQSLLSIKSPSVVNTIPSQSPKLKYSYQNILNNSKEANQNIQQQEYYQNINNNNYKIQNKQQNQQKGPLVKKKICNCRKSNCLKQYCICFQEGELCSDECKCVGCYNNQSSLKIRNEAIEQMLEKNPYAFDQKDDREEIAQAKIQGLKSCKCRKSACQKKYCVCWNEGQRCNDMCQCVDCQNFSPDVRKKIKSEDYSTNIQEDNNSTGQSQKF